MVLSAVLRDPALDPEQTRRRDGDVLGDHRAGVPALARYRSDALIQISSAGETVLLDVRRRLRAAGIPRRATARGHLRDRRAYPDGLLLRLFPDPAAAPEPDRNAEAAAQFDRRCRAAADRHQGG